VALSALVGVGVPVLAGCDLPGTSRGKEGAASPSGSTARGAAPARLESFEGFEGFDDYAPTHVDEADEHPAGMGAVERAAIARTDQAIPDALVT